TTELHTLSLHDALPICQILRGEQHRPKDAEHVTWFADRAAVDPSAVGPARCDLQLDGEFPSLVHHRGTYQRAITTVSHQRCVRGHPKRTQRGDVSYGLHQGGLSLPVRAPQHGRSSSEPAVLVLPSS